jgi:D-beta-D-heptose 7-phosphate kinase/D-beta-D-heptose 1-phosphate adenosyltransferase
MLDSKENKNIVFTNGCFDIIHLGHIKLLEFAKSQGSYLIVGLNSDNSVKRLKGSSRPFNTQDDRKMVLESIRFVDEVIIFEEDTPLELVSRIKPDVIVKGSDYKKEDVVGYHLEKLGLLKVKLFNYVPNYSTTKVLQSSCDR